MTQRGLQWENGLFYRDDKPALMISGEFHYFRVPREDWRDRLRKWKAAGGTTVATYIPWLIHEPEEGSYSFSRHPYDDLEGFLRVCREEGVQVIARPGPYQYSELVFNGLPEWLCTHYPALMGKKLDGTDIDSGSISYMHPLFLEKAEKWIRHVCRMLAPWCAGNGGPVIAVQLDNEASGIHRWFSDGWYDYNPETFGFHRENGRWPLFLKKKYGTPEKLSEAWECPVSSFAEAMPICQDAACRGDVRRLRDYEQCYLEQIADYFELLRQWMTESGIRVPFVHNSPNPESNAEFYEAADRLGENFLLGSDHYYTLGQGWAQNNPTPQYAVRNFCSLEILRNMGMPPTVFEMPSGSASDWPPVLPQDAGAAYLTNLAMGMKGWNYYIYTGGPNVPGTGSTTDLYDYGAPVSAEGECRPLYYEQKRVHGLADQFHLAESRLLTDFTVGYDREMLRADSYRGFREEGFLTPGKAWELTQTGIITTAFCSGLTPELCDLTCHRPDVKKPLAAVTGTVVSRAAQQTLADFLAGGGRLLMGPVLPELDENLRPCRILAEAAGLQPGMLTRESGGIIDMGEIHNVRAELYRSIQKEGMCPLARIRQTGRVVSAVFPAGAGTVIWNGFAWIHGRYEQNEVLEKLLDVLDFEPILKKSERNLFAVVHEQNKRHILFVMNLYSSPLETRLIFCDGQVRRIHLDPMQVWLEYLD